MLVSGYPVALSRLRPSAVLAWTESRYPGLDVMGKSRLAIINSDTETDEEVTLPALSA